MKKSFGQRFKLLLSAGRRDREGIISFIFLILAISTTIQFFSEKQKLSRLSDNQVLFSYLNAFEVDDASDAPPFEEEPVDYERAPFDPNELDKSGWMETGLSERQAESVLKYLSRGKGIFSLADLEKINVLSERWHSKNDPVMVFPPPPPASPHSADVEEAPTIEHLLELNSADTLELVKIRGVGAYSARAIVKYRERLGGFVSYEQLNDIRALREEVKEVLRTKTTLDNRLVRKICIDTCGVETLSQLPYFKSKQVRIILNYREAHGGFTDVSQIKECIVVSDSLFLRVEPYLIICND
jgi:competence protein ComEA